MYVCVFLPSLHLHQLYVSIRSNANHKFNVTHSLYNPTANIRYIEHLIFYYNSKTSSHYLYIVHKFIDNSDNS